MGYRKADLLLSIVATRLLVCLYLLTTMTLAKSQIMQAVSYVCRIMVGVITIALYF